MVRQTWRPGDLKHDPTLRQKTATMGENLFGGNGGRMTLSTACRGWIIEKLDYEGEPVTANGIGKRRKKIGHYTQVEENFGFFLSRLISGGNLAMLIQNGRSSGPRQQKLEWQKSRLETGNTSWRDMTAHRKSVAYRGEVQQAYPEPLI